MRADKAHERLLAMGYMGSERTTRRAVARAKRRWRSEHGRVTRPWVTEPGLWMQWDYGDGPKVAGRSTVLFCAWLAWSRFRVVLPLWDRTQASVVMALDRSLRAFGGAPTYALTDNERTVSVDHVCGIAVRNPQIVAVGRHYGLSIATCVPSDPQSKGGSEATVRIAKADLVPTEPQSPRGVWVLRGARAGVRGVLRAGEHARAPGHAPSTGGDARQERERLHPLPAVRAHAVLRETRRVSRQATVSVGGALYSVPSALVDERVWARVDGSQLIVVHADDAQGPREVARHELTTPGQPSIHDEHYPPRPPGALERKPRAQGSEEAAFLALGQGAEAWLTRAAAAGASRVRRKLSEAVDLSKLHGRARSTRRSPRPGASRRVTCRRSSLTTSRTGRSRFPPGSQRSRRCSAPRRRGRAWAMSTTTFTPRSTLTEVPNGIRVQEIAWITDDPDRLASSASRRLRIDARARELAFELLLAEVAEQWKRHDERPSTPPPPLPEDLDELLRRLRLPYIRARRTACDRDCALAAMGARGRPAGPPRRGGHRPRPSDDQVASQSVRATHGQDPRRVGREGLADPEANPASTTNTRVGRARREPLRLRPEPGPGRVTGSRRSATTRSTKARPSHGTPWRASRRCCDATAPMTAPPRRSQSSPARTSSSSMTSGCSRFSRTLPRRYSASSTPPMRSARSRSPQTFTPPASTS